MTQIPEYALYGESARSGVRADQEHRPLAFHIEEIEARSRGENWVIKPHRHQHLYQLLCVFGSRCEANVGAQSYSLEGNWVLTIPSGIVHEFKFNPECVGVVISVSEQLLAGNQAAELKQYCEPIIKQPAAVEFTEHSAELKTLKLQVDLLAEENLQLWPQKFHALQSLLSLCLLTIRRQHATVHPAGIDATAASRLADQFRHCVEQQYRNHWPVSAYAKELGVSTSTLNRCCQKRFERSPKELILNRVINEAKRRLSFTQQPLAEIAEELGFSDAAYFSRIFKKQTDISPAAYRKNLRY